LAGRAAQQAPRWLANSRSTLPAALAGGALLWAALPPVNWAPLAWVAPVPWLLLARLERLPGRRPYAALWLAGFTFWMAALHWLRLPHWATNFGWVALSGYLAFYLPVFVGLVRVGVHRLRWPLVAAAPVVWTGLELVRAYLLTGFTMASLGHTQYRWLELIQISDLAGGYGVSFLVMLVAAALAAAWPPAMRGAAWSLAAAAVTVGLALGYGRFRLIPPDEALGPRIALIQGSSDTEFGGDPQRFQRMFDRYYRLTEQALEREPQAEVIVWPESMYPFSWITVEPGAEGGQRFPQWTSAELAQAAAKTKADIEALAREFGRPMVINTERNDFGPGGKLDRYNTAILVDPERGIVAWYDKVHPVMFGEYVPFGRWLPWLYKLTPLSSGLTPGAGPQAFQVAGLVASPSICYETVLPQVIRGQVVGLRRQGIEPDVLLNLTNDGWFWGSSELEMHLVCGVFRAVECRKPLLVAANTGISAAIDGDGRILEQGPTRAEAPLVATARRDGRDSLYLRFGDWFARGCLAATALLGLVGLRGIVSKRLAVRGQT
jgi:apolipoprotein N-acyltransferase